MSARTVTVSRVADGGMTVTNLRGSRLSVGEGAADDPRFSPIELLLAALGACTAMDVATITVRRAEPDRFELVVDADKVRDEKGNHLTYVTVTFDIAFPDGIDGDRARDVLPRAIQMSHDRLCTVSRTIQRHTPVTVRQAGAVAAEEQQSAPPKSSPAESC